MRWGFPCSELLNLPLRALASAQYIVATSQGQEMLSWGLKKRLDSTFEVKTFRLQVPRPTRTADGALGEASVQITVPLAALVPIRPLAITRATVEHALKITTVVTPSSGEDRESSLLTGRQEGLRLEGVPATAAEFRRRADREPYLDIRATVARRLPAEGMSCLLDEIGAWTR